ncbi:DUF342 domain-containing protein [Alkalibacillus aidingensis]|uniref:DUF342 domain-containing protein n=1 Tax=Alkalibacillus aidingensis TaxID=2747607 RepID=UPI0016604E66|nr:FapA family protein [Alkalibacillus aidingensis]
MELSQFINMQLSEDKMKAYLEVDHDYIYELDVADDEFENELSPSSIEQFLKEHDVIFGIDEEAIIGLVENFWSVNGPVEVASGKEPIDGKDGYIEYHVNLTTKSSVDEHDQKIDFKEIMKIPLVETGDRLLTIIKPTKGEKGFNVFQEEVKQSPGKEAKIVCGENTKYNLEDSTIYATESGQVSLTEKEIRVLPVYEVNDHLDLNIGNIDFNGSIIIRGDVPDGFSIKARGDVTIEGIVDAANIDAGGSIFIKEGVSSQGKGQIRATLDIHVGNINQGLIEAGRDIVVNQSILHSQVIAREKVLCQRGHIIGGSVSAGKVIESKDIGNRLSTKTSLYLGPNRKVVEKRTQIESRIKELTDQIKKLNAIGHKFKELKETRELTTKERVTLLRQKHSIEKTRLELSELAEEYETYRYDHEDEVNHDFSKVIVNGILYPNVDIIYGKYKKAISKETKFVSIVYKDHDFTLTPI